MAFDRNSNTRARSNNDDTQQGGSFERAKGFLNVYLPSRDGGKAKLEGVALRGTVPNHKALLDAMAKDEAKTLAWIKENLIIEFRSAEPTEGRGFAIDLG